MIVGVPYFEKPPSCLYEWNQKWSLHMRATKQCVHLETTIRLLVQSGVGFHPIILYTMGKRVPSTSRVRKDSMDQCPGFDRPRKKLNYKEIKRRSIIAGLRAMRAPAVACSNAPAIPYLYHCTQTMWNTTRATWVVSANVDPNDMLMYDRCVMMCVQPFMSIIKDHTS